MFFAWAMNISGVLPLRLVLPPLFARSPAVILRFFSDSGQRALRSQQIHETSRRYHSAALRCRVACTLFRPFLGLPLILLIRGRDERQQEMARTAAQLQGFFALSIQLAKIG